MLLERQCSMIVLAGGKSSRMGTDKADLCLNGRTFLEWQIEKGRALGIEDIQVSGYRGTRCAIPVTQDRLSEKGPLGGLEQCLRRAKHPKCLVLSVDVPLVPLSELEKLLHAAAGNTAPVTILKHAEREQPLIAVYDRALAEEMLREITEYKGAVFGFLRRVGYAVYQSQAAEECFSNINSPDAYRKLTATEGQPGCCEEFETPANCLILQKNP